MQSKGWRTSVRSLVRTNWNRAPFAQLAGLAARYLRLWSNLDHDFSMNGESALLTRLADAGVTTVVDVGCHAGVWTDRAVECFPSATVHAFEADPVLAERLAVKYQGSSRVVVNAVGLADESGTLVLNVDPDHRDRSSVIAGDSLNSVPVEVPVVRGDEYAETLGIDRIDMLKVDTEGFDWFVLDGFGDLLGAAVPVVQFEYNGWNMRSRRLLADFYELLGPKGYRIGKIRPNGVVFAPFRLEEENWVGPACLAVHESRPDLIRVLQLGSTAPRRLRSPRRPRGR